MRAHVFLPMLLLACEPAPPVAGKDRHASGASAHTDAVGDSATLPGDTDTDTFVADTDPSDSDTDPSDSDTDPSDTDPSDSDTDIADTDVADSDPGGTDSDPSDSDTDIADTDVADTDPSGTDTDPSDSDDTDLPWIGDSDTDVDTFWEPDPEPIDTSVWIDTDDYAPGKGSCDPAEVRLGWVFPGELGHDWTVVHYPDVVPGTGVGDWTGARGAQAKAEDEHVGTDVAVPNFRWMDRNFPVRAVADGVVVEVRDGQYDRNSTCTGDWNAVTVRHLNGFTATYGHLKRSSLKVRKGDAVRRGQPLAVVGSSGCSTHPQVHLELRGCAGEPVDPWSLALFDHPPPYDPPLRVMDAYVVEGDVTRVEQAQDPGPDARVLLGNRAVTYGVTLAGGEPGDAFGVDVRRPDGVLFLSIRNHLTRNDPLHQWWWSRTVGDFAGTWTMEVSVNGRLVQERSWDVIAQASAFAVPEADLADVIDGHAAEGLQPVWLDVYGMAGQRYYNLIAEPLDRTTEVWWGVDGATHEANAAAAEAAGLRLIHVDTTDAGGSAVYLGIAAELPGDVTAFTDAPAATFWGDYDALQSAGMRPRSLIERLDGGGSPRYTAIFDDDDVGTFVTVTGVLRADVFDVHTAQRAVGRNLAWMDARNLGTDAYFVGVWDDRPRGNWTLRTVMRLPELEASHEEARQRGFRLRAVTGYERYGEHRLAAFWSER